MLLVNVTTADRRAAPCGHIAHSQCYIEQSMSADTEYVLKREKQLLAVMPRRDLFQTQLPSQETEKRAEQGK